MASVNDPGIHAIPAPDSTASPLLGPPPTQSPQVLEKTPSSSLNGNDQKPRFMVETVATEPTFTEVALNWAIKILGLAAAVVFGIWAPISYKATADGNSSSDAAQSSLVDAQASMNGVANSAMNIAASASSEASDAQASMIYFAEAGANIADALNSRMVAIGQLYLYSYCDTNTVRSTFTRSGRVLKTDCGRTLQNVRFSAARLQLQVWLVI